MLSQQVILNKAAVSQMHYECVNRQVQWAWNWPDNQAKLYLQVLRWILWTLEFLSCVLFFYQRTAFMYCDYTYIKSEWLYHIRCGYEAVLMTVLFPGGIFYAVGLASLCWIGPLFKWHIVLLWYPIYCAAYAILWVMVRCRDVFLPVWSVRCGYEAVLMTVLSPQWGLLCCCVGIFILNWSHV